MGNLFNKEVLGNPLVVGAAVVVVVIALGGGLYYALGSRAPEAPALSADTASTTLRASGTVEPAENPNLAFVSGGRVAGVNVAVGSQVSRGEVLASLDTASLSASRAQAAAQEAAQEASLSQMQAGPRSVDVAGKQTALDLANQTLANDYASAYNALSSAYGNAYGSLHANTDSLFTNPDTTVMALTFQTNSNTAQNGVLNARMSATGELAAFNGELNSLSSNSAPQAIESELVAAQAHLDAVRSYSVALSGALASAIITGNFTAATEAAANASNASLLTAVNAQIAAVQAAAQKIASDKLQVTSAQNALDLLNAGASAQDLEAGQAQVDAARAAVASIDASIANALIVAPFSGTVASVQVKQGDIVAPNTVAVSITPHSALEVDAYFSSIDAARIRAGQDAAVMLDAYPGRAFAATVSSVDTSPTMQGSVPAYKVVLQFAQSDPAITTGMTAEVTISSAK